MEAIKKGFEMAEHEFTNNFALNNGELVDKSGSCALVVMIINDELYIANVGDSRAVMSFKGGNIVKAVTNDHKPSEQKESARIIENGGKIYQYNINN
jgi:protein phosphatase 2C family protein 2/3